MIAAAVGFRVHIRAHGNSSARLTGSRDQLHVLIFKDSERHFDDVHAENSTTQSKNGTSRLRDTRAADTHFGEKIEQDCCSPIWCYSMPLPRSYGMLLHAASP